MKGLHTGSECQAATQLDNRPQVGDDACVWNDIADDKGSRPRMVVSLFFWGLQGDMISTPRASYGWNGNVPATARGFRHRPLRPMRPGRALIETALEKQPSPSTP